DVQRWRARSSAILTGSGTALADNPRLTVRIDEPFTPPMRVLLDRQLRVGSHSHLFDGSAPSLVLHASGATTTAADNLEYATVPVAGDQLDLAAVMKVLAARDCNEVQVEAGPTLCGALFEAGLVDELLLYVAPVLLGD